MSNIRWTPGIGDPSIMGWLTVVMYFLCVLGAFHLYKKPQLYFDRETAKQKAFWMLLCVSMLLLGINKQLDVQSLFTEIGRAVSRQQGWYQARHDVQRQFIFTVIVLGGCSMIAIMLAFKSIAKKNLLSIVGICLVIVFVVSRAASFHHMDNFINRRFLGLKMNWIVELGGITLILLNILIIKKGESPLSGEQHPCCGPKA